MRRALATLAIAAAGLGAVGCGRDEGDPIPQKEADGLVKSIDQVRRQVAVRACGTLLRTTLPGLEQRARDLDSGVGSDVRTTISDGIAHLRDLAVDECTRQEQQPTTDQSTSETSSSDTTPSTTETTPSTDTSNTDTSTSDTSNTDTSTQDTSPPSTDTNTDTGGGGVTPPTTPTTPTTP